MRGRLLIIAGSDFGGEAGIQADIKAVTAVGGYAATAITALTAQNTQGGFGIVGVAPAFIAQQMRLVLEDIGADCINTGMLHNSVVIETIVEVLATAVPAIPLVVDPVMFAKGGEPLLAEAARETLVRRLLPRATVLTPNLPEAEALSGMILRDADTLQAAAYRLLERGPAAVLLKGGHLPGDPVVDLLVSRDGVVRFTHPRCHHQHPRHRLYAGFSHCDGPGSGIVPERCGEAGAGLCPEGDPDGARPGRGQRAFKSRSYCKAV
jgi:hydroxymethylpyrimidine/phosphomethylpyrimidine kinase